MSVRSPGNSPKEDVTDKIIQGVLFFPSIGGWKHFILRNFGGGDYFVLFKRQTKKKLYEIELWEQMELFPEAFQICFLLIN